MKSTPKNLDAFLEALKKYFVGVVHIENDILYAKKIEYYENVLKPKMLQEIEKLQESETTENLEKIIDMFIEFFEAHYKDLEKYNVVPFSPYHIMKYKIVQYHNDSVLFDFDTKHLYYYKNDYAFQNQEIKIDNYKFVFDASKAARKKNNVKTDIIFTLKDVKQTGQETIIEIAVNQKETQHGDKHQSDLQKEIEEKYSIKIDGKIIRKALSKYERKTKKVDYFIMKDPKNDLMQEFKSFVAHLLISREM